MSVFSTTVVMQTILYCRISAPLDPSFKSMHVMLYAIEAKIDRVASLVNYTFTHNSEIEPSDSSRTILSCRSF
jgi:hypothetical protein